MRAAASALLVAAAVLPALSQSDLGRIREWENSRARAERSADVAESTASAAVLAAAVLPPLSQSDLGRIREWEKSRARAECSADVVGSMGLAPGGAAADVGAGEGFYSELLAEAVGPEGRVYAIDIDEASLRTARRRMKEAGLRNVTVMKGKTDATGLEPESVDAVLVMRAYHEFTRPEAMLADIRRALRPGGRLVIIDHANRRSSADDSRRTQARRHEISIGIVAAELEQAGFHVTERREPLCDPGPAVRRHRNSGQRMWLLVAGRQAPM